VQRDRLAALFLLELTTGIRRGQICGLKWSAVDLDAGEITVHDNRVVVRGHAREKAGGKTRNADKTVSIDRTTLATLRRWRKRQNGERELLGTEPPRHVRRLHLLGRMGSWQVGGIRQSCVSARCGWS
jgi:integrase